MSIQIITLHRKIFIFLLLFDSDKSKIKLQVLINEIHKPYALETAVDVVIQPANELPGFFAAVQGAMFEE